MDPPASPLDWAGRSAIRRGLSNAGWRSGRDAQSSTQTATRSRPSAWPRRARRRRWRSSLPTSPSQNVARRGQADAHRDDARWRRATGSAARQKWRAESRRSAAPRRAPPPSKTTNSSPPWRPMTAWRDARPLRAALRRHGAMRRRRISWPCSSLIRLNNRDRSSSAAAGAPWRPAQGQCDPAASKPRRLSSPVSGSVLAAARNSSRTRLSCRKVPTLRSAMGGVKDDDLEDRQQGRKAQILPRPVN